MKRILFLTIVLLLTGCSSTKTTIRISERHGLSVEETFDFKW